MKKIKLPYEIEFKSGELSNEKFYILSFKGEEALNESYSFFLKIISDKYIDLNSFLKTKNRNVCFTMNINKRSRFIHGICLEASIESMVNKLFIYEIKVCAPISSLSIGKSSNVFLDMKIEDIISSILKEKRFINRVDYEFNLNPKPYDSSKENYEEIDYMCQYNESNFTFIQKWMSEFGIRLHFIQDESNTKMIFSDHNNAFKSLENETLEFLPMLNYQTDNTEAISFIKLVQKRIPLKSLYINNDLRYDHIDFEVDGKVAGIEDIHDTELTHFGGTPFLQINSTRYQIIEDERLKSQSKIILLNSNNHLISPGFTFKVKNHFFLNENDSLLILKVNHKGNQLSYLKNLQNEMGNSLLGYNLSTDYNIYENSFETIDTAIEYRVPRIKNRKTISGIILAKIKGEEGGTQAYRGEDCAYKVKMPFNTISSENKYSAWIHTLGDSQGRGMHIRLNDGDDVAIGFMEGDVNRPYIVGAINQRGTIMEEGVEAKMFTGSYLKIIGKTAKESYINNGGKI